MNTESISIFLMNNKLSFPKIFAHGINLLRQAEIYSSEMENILDTSFNFPDALANEMIRLNHHGILTPETIKAIVHYTGNIVFLTNGILKLHEHQLMTPKLLEILISDFCSPDKKADALILLHQNDMLQDNILKILTHSQKNPVKLCLVLIELKKLKIQNDEFDLLKNKSLDLDLLYQALILFNKNEYRIKSAAVFLKEQRNVFQLAQAYITLSKHQIDTDSNLDLLNKHLHPMLLAQALTKLHQEKLDTPQNIQRLINSNDLLNTTQDILGPYLLKKSVTRGLRLGFFTAVPTLSLIWGLAPSHFMQFTLSLGLYHPAITLLVFSILFSMCIAVTFFLQQQRLNQQAKLLIDESKELKVMRPSR